MDSKTGLLTRVTIISSIISALLIFAYFMGIDIGLEIGILFVAITEMLLGISQYELSKGSNRKRDKITGDLCFAVGVIVLIVVIIWSII